MESCVRRTRTITHAGRNLAYTCARAHTHTRVYTHTQKCIHVYSHSSSRERSNTAIGRPYARVRAPRVGRGGGGSYGEAKGIERDAGKSACTRTQQRQQQQQQQQQHPPMISLPLVHSRTVCSSLLHLSPNFLSFSRFCRREGWKPSASRWMPLTTLHKHPLSPPAKPPSPSFQPLSVLRPSWTRPRVLNVLTTECEVILQV